MTALRVANLPNLLPRDKPARDPRAKGPPDSPREGKDAAKEKVEKAPVMEVIRRQPKEIILSALLRVSEQAPFYVFTAFVFAYAVGTLKMSRDFILFAVMAAACVSFFSIPIAGHLSDKIGRKNMYLLGVVTMGVFGFIYFAMVDTASPALVFIANSARYAVRATGSFDRGVLHAEPALQRRFAWLSVGLDHRRRSGAAHRNLAVRAIPHRLRDLGLYRDLCGDQLHCDGDDARLYRQGHFGRRLQRGLAPYRQQLGGRALTNDKPGSGLAGAGLFVFAASSANGHRANG